MKKIKSLFCRNYDTDGLVCDEVVLGSEWVLSGEGVATVKFDGTCCLVRDGRLSKRYDRKLTRANFRRKKAGHPGPWAIVDFKPAPPGWEACEPEPDQVTTHWPGWVTVGDEPESKWHREAWVQHGDHGDGTYELVGPRVQGNPYGLDGHWLWRHGGLLVTIEALTFVGVRALLEARDDIEGIVWHHPDGRMVKIKRRDFGFDWPVRFLGNTMLTNDQRELADLMREISVRCSCVRWFIGLEHILWEMVSRLDYAPIDWGFDRVTSAELAKLAWLAVTCDGWICWSDGDRSETFVPIGEWRRMYRVPGGGNTHQGSVLTVPEPATWPAIRSATSRGLGWAPPAKP